MSFEFFLARRLHFSPFEKKRISSPAIRIAVVGIAIGIMAMLLSLCIVMGFKNMVQEKLISLGAHMTITSAEGVSRQEPTPLIMSKEDMSGLKNIPEVVHVQGYITTPAVIKTDNDFQGVVYKGIDSNYRRDFIRQNLTAGDIPDSLGRGEVVISQYIADRLRLQLGDSFLSYFIQEDIRVRKLTIVGIYQTHWEEYDQLFIISGADLLRQVNRWESNQWSGIELTCSDFSQIEPTKEQILLTPKLLPDQPGGYWIQTIYDQHPGIFAWLELLDMNAIVIISLMLIVSSVTMISCLLILIVEQVNLIGLLKALGARGASIRRIFLYFAGFIILKGLMWGNMIAFILCFAQKHFGIIKLDPSIYYLSQVPIEINLWIWIGINVGALLISMLTLVAPSFVISRISPAKSIKYE